MIIILLFLYAFVFIHLIRHAAEVFREEWKLDRKYLEESYFINLIVFAAAYFIDRAVPLEEPDDTIF